MALPELLLPPGTPAFQANGHQVDFAPHYADIAFRTGHSRRRRIYSIAPRLVQVSLQLTQAQMAAFDTWFEGPLQQGALFFTAAVANQGAGLLYWQARFEAPYQADPGDAAAMWTVTATLRLVGDGSAMPPVSTSLASDVVCALVGAAALAIPQTLSSDITVALLTASGLLSSDITVALTSIVNGAAPEGTLRDRRWVYMRYPYSRGQTEDITDPEAIRRNWVQL